MQISVIIPNFNGRGLLEKNLPSVLEAVGKSQMIIVDDGSTDGSVEFIKKHYPQITLIEKVTNSGFATSVNLGVKAATGEIIFLLNTDVVPEKNCLPSLVKHFEDSLVFAVGCMDESVEDGKIVKRGRGIGKFVNGFLIHGRGETDKPNTLWASGGSSAFSKSIWEKLGGMDELYNPFYWEDIDLSYRALRSGYKIIFEPKAKVVHRHAEGSIAQNYSAQKIKKLSYRNQIIFVWKNITSKAYLMQHLFWLPLSLIISLVKGDLDFIAGFMAALIQLPGVIRQSQQALKSFVRTDEEVLAPFSHE